MDVALLADTHVPDREREIPAPFRERVRDADHAVHAGDFTDPEVLADLEALATDLTAVHGNMDPGDIGLPSVATVDAGGVTFAVTHGTVRSRDAWFEAVADAARATGADPVVGVGAHTHRVEDTVHEGVRLLNPGSATGADPAERATMMTASVVDGDVDATVHEA